MEASRGEGEVAGKRRLADRLWLPDGAACGAREEELTLAAA